MKDSDTLKFRNIIASEPTAESSPPKVDRQEKEDEFFTHRRGPLSRLGGFVVGIWDAVSFILLIILYVTHAFLHTIFSYRWFPRSIAAMMDTMYDRLARGLDVNRRGRVDRSYLIELSLRNMQVKKTRTYITMGGIAIGIAFIVFLVSVGYGLQNLVISRVARLEELRQADALPGLTQDLSLTDETLSKFAQIPGVTSTMPLIALVGKVSYNQSVSDMAVYGVTADYLKDSAIQPIYGKIFESNSLSSPVSKSPTSRVVQRRDEQQEAEAARAELPMTFNQELGEVKFSIEPNIWLRVRATPETTGRLLGYTRRADTTQVGTEVYGDNYSNSGSIHATQDTDADAAPDQPLGKWVKSQVPLWQHQSCPAPAVDPETGQPQATPPCQEYTPLIDETGQQLTGEGYVAEISMSVTPIQAAVLGITDSSAGQNETDASSLLAQARSTSGSLPLVDLATDSAQAAQSQTRIVTLSSDAERVAVVNRSVLQVLGIPEQEAVGKTINLTFVLVGDLVDESVEKVESAPVDYTIVGVTPDEGTPMVYVPFIDMRSLGIVKYSQIKVVVDDKANLDRVRATIEAGGFGTVSVADTVAQIDNLFASFRLVLAIVGMVALSVAALGMFNTLTVSLLERTREVGLMKAMGMKSHEVKELFLTESMVMGFFGGVIGLLLGILLGKVVSLGLSAFSLIKGVGFIDISYAPFSFVVIVAALSILVGVITGYFPARRATKISALNALRYE